MADLKTNYVDDVLDTTKNQLRKYQQIQNDDGTVSFVDVTEYTQVGTSFGAKDINDTNAAINAVNGKLQKINGILSINTNYGKIVSENCNYYENGTYYIDIFVTIGLSVPVSAQLFSINRGSGTQIISKRLDGILEGASDNYFIACISNNTFMPNTKPVNAGVYKLKMIIKE
jgi:hypothetical protein